MLKRLLIICSTLSFGAFACQDLPVRTENDVNEWKSGIFDHRERNGSSYIVDIVFPLEFNGYALNNVRLFKGEGNDSDEFILPIDISSDNSIRAIVGKDIINELVFYVIYGQCGYRFEYGLG